MNDIIANFLGWLTAVIALLKFFIQIIAFCLPISLFLLLCSTIFWVVKTFFSRIEHGWEDDLDISNNENEN